MINARLADQPSQTTDEQRPIDRATVLKAFVIIAILSFVLRIAYAGHLYEDDGLWFTAAEELVRAKALYREIYFDKPPALPLLYAGLFKLFGAHILTIRLFTIAYSFAISVVIYKFGSWVYDKRGGLIAATMFTFFSTTAATGHTQGFDTDLLLVLPYTASAYLLTRACFERRAWLAVAGGILTGVGVQVNPKAAFNLLFFAVLLIVAWSWLNRNTRAKAKRGDPASSVGLVRGLRLLLLALAGSIAGSLPFLVYLTLTHSLMSYWLYVWVWGASYAKYNTLSNTIALGLRANLGYFSLNSILLITLVYVVVTTVRRARRVSESPGSQPSLSSECEKGLLVSDVTLLIWLTTSYAGLCVGGRFYSHYFFQIMPSLSLIGARGLVSLVSSLQGRDKRIRAFVIALLMIAFTATVVRFHTRTVILAADWVKGKKSESTLAWFHERLNREERLVAALVRELPENADAADQLGAEAIRGDGPRTRAAHGPADYVFVWGYRPEIYYWSGLLPASRFLSSQPLTGVPADVHYFSDQYHSVLDETVTAKARVQLVQDLEVTQPKYIVDEIGFFNGDLAILKYPELQDVMSKYKYIGPTGRFLIYIRRDLRKKNLALGSAGICLLAERRGNRL